MKYYVSFCLLFFLCQLVMAQNSGPQQITPEILVKIKSDVDKQAIGFTKKLKSENVLSTEQIRFSVDTFKIERISSKCIDIDYTTAGMSKAVYQLAASYDVLMNKYYKKLLGVLGAEDKKVLISAQRAWVTYRDAEAKFIYTMIDEKYSGGGTMQINIAAASYCDLVRQRAIELFDYYNEIVQVTNPIIETK